MCTMRYLLKDACDKHVPFAASVLIHLWYDGCDCNIPMKLVKCLIKTSQLKSISHRHHVCFLFLE